MRAEAPGGAGEPGAAPRSVSAVVTTAGGGLSSLLREVLHQPRGSAAVGSHGDTRA